MDPLAPFRIPFVGLKPGKHTFRMEVDATFFDSFPETEAIRSTGEATVSLDKLGSSLDSQISFTGESNLPCDRCLSDVQVPLKFEERLVVRLGNQTDLESEIWTLGAEVHELDLSQPIFEWIHLHLPIRKVHVDETLCDPEMMQHLDNNAHPEDTPSGDDDDTKDPRWNALKDLK